MSFSSTTSGPGSQSGSTSPSPVPMPDPGVSPGFGDPLGLGALEWLGQEELLAESGTADLLSTASGDGLSDPYSVQQGGWLLGELKIDPYTNAPQVDTPSGPYVGADVDPYTNAAPNDNPNAYAGGMNLDPYSGRQPESSIASAGSPVLAFGIEADAANGPVTVRVESVYDENGEFFGYRYVNSDGTSVVEPFDRISRPSNIMNFTELDTAYIVVPGSSQPGTPPQITAPIPASAPLPESQSAAINQAASPQPQSTLQRSAASPATATPFSGPVRTLPETTIVAEMPFSPDVSHPDALARAQGAGRIERGDLWQAVKGAYNGLVGLAPLAAGPVTGPILNRLQLIPKAPIDPRYGGAAIVGEQFAQNLAFEAMSALPAVGRGLTRALGEDKVIAQSVAGRSTHWMSMLPDEQAILGVTPPSNSALPLPTLGQGLSQTLREESVVVEHLGETPARWTDKPWYDYQVRATGTDAENVFRITRNGDATYVYADALTNDFIVEAKAGDMEFLKATARDESSVSSAFYDLMKRQEHVINQANNYLLISDQLGYRGVRYVVSDAEGAKVLLERFTAEFPEAVASGKISVWWVP